MSARHHHRRHHHHVRRPAWPDTAMARAYLAALTSWAIAHHTDTDATVVLPVGRATAFEVLRVLHALDRARQPARRSPRAPSQAQGN